MDNIFWLLPLCFLAAYLLGSLPTSVWVGKHFFNIDPRQHGSGNAGATNTLRVLGHKAAIPVLLFDILKGFVAVQLFYALVPPTFLPHYRTYLAIATGLMAVVGHIYSIFLAFKGGKGVATFAGVAIALSPLALLLCAFIFVSILLISRYVSLSSILTASSYPLVIFFLYHDTALILFGLMAAATVLLTHRKNIQRLIHGKESKISFKKPSI